MTEWTQGRMTTFRCLNCAQPLGVWPETTQGVPARCAACAALPPTINPAWLRTPPARLGQSAAERRGDAA